MANLQIVPSNKNVEAQYVEMMVPLYSFGCEKKVKKTLSHLKGIYSVNVDYNQQKVTVWGICNKYDVLATVRSKRKDARFWNQEDNIALEESQPKLAPPSPPPKEKYNNVHIKPKDYYTIHIKPTLALARVRSLSWKAMKKVFTRSNSF